MIIRPATAADIPALAALYAHHVLHGFGTFEEVPPSEAEMLQRWEAVTTRGLPWVVAEDGVRVLAYAYAGPYRLRSAYRYAVEDSVYVAPDAMGRGLGRLVLQRVLDDCEAMGLRRVAAVIGDSGNAGSIGLHRALGFERVGTLSGMGYKHGRWLDVVLMQKALNGGDESAPEAAGLNL